MDHTLRCKTLSSLRQGSYYINLAQCQNYNRHFPSISSTELKWSILDSKGRAHIKDKMCFLSGCVGHTVIPLGLKSWLLETFESLIPKWPWVLESSDGDTLNCFRHKTNFSFVYIWVLYGSMSPLSPGLGVTVLSKSMFTKCTWPADVFTQTYMWSIVTIPSPPSPSLQQMVRWVHYKVTFT